MWPFSPSCSFVFKVCFRFIAESTLFISCVTGNFPYSFLFLIALLKNSQLCVSKVSLLPLTINYALTFIEIHILFFLSTPLNHHSINQQKILFLALLSVFSRKAAENNYGVFVVVLFWKRKWIYIVHTCIAVRKYIRCQYTYGVFWYF